MKKLYLAAFILLCLMVVYLLFEIHVFDYSNNIELYSIYFLVVLLINWFLIGKKENRRKALSILMYISEVCFFLYLLFVWQLYDDSFHQYKLFVLPANVLLCINCFLMFKTNIDNAKRKKSDQPSVFPETK